MSDIKSIIKETNEKLKINNNGEKKKKDDFGFGDSSGGFGGFGDGGFGGDFKEGFGGDFKGGFGGFGDDKTSKDGKNNTFGDASSSSFDFNSKSGTDSFGFGTSSTSSEKKEKKKDLEKKKTASSSDSDSDSGDDDWSKTIENMKKNTPTKVEPPKVPSTLKTNVSKTRTPTSTTKPSTATTTKPPTTTPTVRKPVRQVSDDDYIAKLSWEQLNEKIKAKHGGVGIPKDVLVAPTRDIKGHAYWRKWPTPSKPQATFLPVFFDGMNKKDTKRPQHFVVQAKNGAGKTGVYVMSALCAIDPKIASPQVLVVVRNFELVREVWEKTATPLCHLSGYPLPGILCYGHENLVSKAKTTPIVIAQYGFLMDLIKRKKFTNFEKLKMIIFDEADAFLKVSRTGEKPGQMLINFYDRMARVVPRDTNPRTGISNFFISATFTKDELEMIDTRVLKIKGNPRDVVTRSIIDDEERLLIKKMSLFHVDVRKYASDRDRQVCYNNIVHFFVSQIDATQTIIFCEERKIVHALKAYLDKEGIPASVLTGKPMDTETRKKNLKEFRDQKTRILVTTSVISRGIDIPSVEIVVNLGIPRKGWEKRNSTKKQVLTGDADTFRHRCGRTARFGRKGVAITVTHSQEEWNFFAQICTDMGITKDRFRSFPMEEVKSESGPLITEINKLING